MWAAPAQKPFQKVRSFVFASFGRLFPAAGAAETANMDDVRLRGPCLGCALTRGWPIFLVTGRPPCPPARGRLFINTYRVFGWPANSISEVWAAPAAGKHKVWHFAPGLSEGFEAAWVKNQRFPVYQNCVSRLAKLRLTSPIPPRHPAQPNPTAVCTDRRNTMDWYLFLVRFLAQAAGGRTASGLRRGGRAGGRRKTDVVEFGSCQLVNAHVLGQLSSLGWGRGPAKTSRPSPFDPCTQPRHPTPGWPISILNRFTPLQSGRFKTPVSSNPV